MRATQLARILDLTDYHAVLEIIESHCRGKGRPAQIRDDGELVIGVRDRVAIRVVARAGNPELVTRATHRDAIGDVLALVMDLYIHHAARNSALEQIRRALENAAIDPGIAKPVGEESRVEWLDCCDVPDVPCDASWCDCDLPSCDVPCDGLPCDF